MNLQFIEFVGKASLNGKSVVAYRQDDGKIRLKAETTGFRPVQYKSVDEDGQARWKTVPDMILTESEFSDFKEKITNGFDQDANIVYKALIKMGYPEDLFDEPSAH